VVASDPGRPRATSAAIAAGHDRQQPQISWHDAAAGSATTRGGNSPEHLCGLSDRDFADLEAST
jgi:hypothetical protein